jgi:hypothetical protein
MEVMSMRRNIFAEAAECAKFCAPFAPCLLIAPVGAVSAPLGKIPELLPFPVLYVTATGYIPYATKAEIVRRRSVNLILLGGEDNISGWVAYALSTLTSGNVYRLTT